MKLLAGMVHLLIASQCTLLSRRVASRTWARPSGLLSQIFLSSSSISTQQTHFDERLQAVQQKMSELNLDALIVPTSDPHLSEYIADHYGRREFISKFTGSAGTAVITNANAYLFTDGRYHKQAELELGSCWTLMKSGLSGVPTLNDFLCNQLPRNSKLGIDPFEHSADSFKSLSQAIRGVHKIVPIPPDNHPIDQIWHHRPPRPHSQLREHPICFAGKSREEKILAVRQALAAKGAQHLVVAALDEVMWLFNIRGSDVSCNPVSICYATISTGL